MAHTTVPTKNPGDLLGATDWNTYVRDNDAFNFSGKACQTIARNNGSDYTPGASFADVDATNLSITLSLVTGRVVISAQCVIKAAPSQSIDCYLDVAIDGTRQGGTNGITVESATNLTPKGAGFHLIVAGLSAGSHTFKLQAKQVHTGVAGVIVSSAASFAHFSVMEF